MNIFVIKFKQQHYYTLIQLAAKYVFLDGPSCVSS